MNWGPNANNSSQPDTQQENSNDSIERDIYAKVKQEIKSEEEEEGEVDDHRPDNFSSTVFPPPEQRLPSPQTPTFWRPPPNNFTRTPPPPRPNYFPPHTFPHSPRQQQQQQIWSLPPLRFQHTPQVYSQPPPPGQESQSVRFSPQSNSRMPLPPSPLPYAGSFARPNPTSPTKTNPIKVRSKGYFCEVCKVGFPAEGDGLNQHTNGKFHEIELFKSLDVLEVIDRRCHCKICDMSVGFRFQEAVSHFMIKHHKIHKKVVEIKKLPPDNSTQHSTNHRNFGKASAPKRPSSSSSSSSSSIKHSALNQANNLPNGFKVLDRTLYCDICKMKLPIDADLKLHCSGRKHEIELLKVEGAITLKDNKCHCEICNTVIGFGFKQALKHVKGKHAEEYKKMQRKKEFEPAKNEGPTADTSSSSLSPSDDKGEVAAGGDDVKTEEDEDDPPSKKSKC